MALLSGFVGSCPAGWLVGCLPHVYIPHLAHQGSPLRFPPLHRSRLGSPADKFQSLAPAIDSDGNTGGCAFGSYSPLQLSNNALESAPIDGRGAAIRVHVASVMNRENPFAFSYPWNGDGS
jgi:hypothetical protein